MSIALAVLANVSGVLKDEQNMERFENERKSKLIGELTPKSQILFVLNFVATLYALWLAHTYVNRNTTACHVMHYLSALFFSIFYIIYMSSKAVA